eukprot:7925639-Pyramimonas_sp.AAC.1
MKQRVHDMMIACQSWISSVPINRCTEKVHTDIFELATPLAVLQSILDLAAETDSDNPKSTSPDNAFKKYEGIVTEFNMLTE